VNKIISTFISTIEHQNGRTPNNKYYGFNVIELLVTIAIIAILGTIAISSYKSYNTKAIISSAFDILETYKTSTAKLIAIRGSVSSFLTNDVSNYILFPDGDTTGQISGNTNCKTISSTYVTQICAYIINSNSVLIGAALIPTGAITSTNNYLYIAYNQNNKWICGTSASQTNNISSTLLSSTCNQALP
jgi:prepilin-type N-terminal cleavage/methylation domain-containing protein